MLRSLGFRLVRLARYIVRDRTGRAWVVGIIAALLYLILHQQALRSVLLAFLGVTITFIVLPDVKTDIRTAVEDSNLLLTNPHAIASQLTPSMAQHIASSITQGLTEYQDRLRPLGLGPSSTEWPYKYGALPLLDLWTNPTRLVLDHAYSIRLRVMGDPFPTLYSVTAISHNRQILPTNATNSFVVSFCRTVRAFVDEFSNAACIGRNLVDVDLTTWEQLCVEPAKYFAVALSAQLDDGTELLVESGQREITRDGDVLRFQATAQSTATLRDARLKYHEELTYPFPARYRTFTAKFASYFCGGSTNVNFEIEDPSVSALTLVNYMSSVGDYRSPHYQEPEHRTARGGRSRATGVSYSNRLFWPGSGIVFVWERRNDEDG